jgi:DNA polymerase-1
VNVGGVNVVRTLDDAAEMWRWLGTLDWVTFDTEATGLEMYDPAFHVRLVQFGSKDNAWVVPMEDWVGLVKDVFTRYQGTFVAHNSRYDAAALMHHGVVVPLERCEDTMIMLRLAEPTLSAGLKEASVRHVSSASATGQKVLREAMRKTGWTFETIPLEFEPFIFYAALDSVLTAHLFDTDVAKTGRASPVYELEMQCRAACNRMERNGIRVDVERADLMSQTMTREADDLKVEALDRWRVNVTSTYDVGHWLMASDARHLLTKSTPGGKPSVDKEILEIVIAHGGEAGDLAGSALRVRRLEKLVATYFSHFAEDSDGDGFLHADIESLAARTGRMSIRNPPFQTLPRTGGDVEANGVRLCIIPREDDHVVISADYSQIELRKIASLSSDPGMIEAFKAADAGGVDFFTKSLQDVYGDTSLTKSDPRRQTLKNAWYARSYGAGVEKMALTAGVPVHVMAEVNHKITAAYPLYARLGDLYAQEARDNNGWIMTRAGRRLKVEEGKEYTALNAAVQGGAADVMKQAIVRLAQAGFDDYMMAPVHDEIVVSVPRELEAEARHEIEVAMRDDTFAVPLIADASPGCANWAEAKS